MHKALAIVFRKGHQKGNSPEAEGNLPADAKARTVATRPVGPSPHLLPVVPYPELPPSLTYTAEEDIYFQDKGATTNQQEWWTTWMEKLGSHGTFEGLSSTNYTRPHT